MRKLAGILVVLSLISAGCQTKEPPAEAQSAEKSTRYEDLLALWRQFRDFQKPNVVEGVPDYTPKAMSAQQLGAGEFLKRLAAIDPAGWPIDRQVDYHIVRAEFNGFDFDHRVLRPWSKDPCFYAVLETSEPDVPAREGPQIFGALCLTDFSFPLDKDQHLLFAGKLRAIPGILAQAKSNLTEVSNDQRLLGIRQKRDEGTDLDRLGERLKGQHADLVPVIVESKKAVEDFRAWLENQTGLSKTPSGIGVVEYDWTMKNIHYVPYTWAQQLELVQRELERSLAYLRLEEQRNRDLPPLEPSKTLEEQRRRLAEGNDHFFKFLRERDIFTVPEYMRLNTESRSFIPPEQRDFFSQVDYRDVLPLRCHSIHWLEKQREKFNTHPLRSVPLLYNIWDSRAEGLATGFEEFMMGAGLYDRNPRSRELVFVMLAFRCIRALCDLRLHSNEWTVEDAVKFAVETTPFGWAKLEGATIWGDLAIYLNQPGYGTSYVVGKNQFEKLLADVARQKGGAFRVKAFLDDYFARGIIPASLIRWEMTGWDDEMKILLNEDRSEPQKR
ncbi:MAG: DUF885 family protein [Candidatus Aminicenantes bacterium]|nr:DUF885 family protein [Candidatus Aminicenantes bacterium]